MDCDDGYVRGEFTRNTLRKGDKFVSSFDSFHDLKDDVLCISEKKKKSREGEAADLQQRLTDPDDVSRIDLGPFPLLPCGFMRRHSWHSWA